MADETVMKMPPDVKAKWLEALRSGRYKQGQGELRTVDNCFCCLGVLCDVLDPNGWNDQRDHEYDNDISGGSLSLTMNHNFVGVGDEGTLIEMNDTEHKSFAQIADYIESNL